LDLIRARPWCRHLGFAGREELRKHMSGATMLALPSLEDNCPMTVLESMAAGLPVMAARVGGVPDLIEAERTGIFCDPLDAKSMSEAVEKILMDPAAAWEMAKRAKQEARERFHPKIIAQSHLEIYQEVLRTAS
jgi:L-malate glycosyltransferase